MGVLRNIYDWMGKRIEASDYVDSDVVLSFEQLAYEVLAVKLASSYIADAISQCEIKVYEHGEAVKNDLYYRLNVSPNPNQSGSQFINDIVTRICTAGQSLVVPYRSKHFYIDECNGVHVDKTALKDWVFHSITVDDQLLPGTYRASNVYFFKLTDNAIKNTIGQVYNDYGVLMGAVVQGANNSYGNKYKLKMERVKAGDEKFVEYYNNTLKKQLQEFLTSPNAVHPEYAGYDLQPIDVKGNGSVDDVSKMRKEIFDVVAQAFKIPVSMMYGNTNNTAEVIKQFLTFAVDPIAAMISDEITRKSFTFREWQDGCKVVVDTTKIEHVNIFSVASDLDKLIASGVFSIDGVLEQLGLEPIGDEFSRSHFVTKNYGLLTDETVNSSDIKGGE